MTSLSLGVVTISPTSTLFPRLNQPGKEALQAEQPQGSSVTAEGHISAPTILSDGENFAPSCVASVAS